MQRLREYLLLINSCAKYPIKWQRSSVNVTQESIEEVLDWIYELPCAPTHDEVCTIEALVEATEDEVPNTYMLFSVTSSFCPHRFRNILLITY